MNRTGVPAGDAGMLFDRGAFQVQQIRLARRLLENVRLCRLVSRLPVPDYLSPAMEPQPIQLPPASPPPPQVRSTQTLTLRTHESHSLA